MEKLNDSVSLRVTPEQHTKIKAFAEFRNCDNPGEYLRLLVHVDEKAIKDEIDRVDRLVSILRAAQD